MVHPSKAKGDRNERDAVAFLVATVPDLLVDKPERMLGAGRKDDVGDLRVFPEVAVQVRAYGKASLLTGLRSAAVDAAAQAANGRMPLGLGLVPFPNARAATQVRWLATTTVWPDLELEARDFGAAASRAVAWVRDDVGPKTKPNPRARKAPVPHPDRLGRVAYIHGRDAEPYYLAPVEAWLAVYRHLRAASAAA